MYQAVLLALTVVVGADGSATQYRDGRWAAKLRLDAVDHGVVLRHGDGPGQCDILGARDVWVYEADGTYYMHYDAAGPIDGLGGEAGKLAAVVQFQVGRPK